MPRVRPATAIAVAGLFLSSGCTLLRGAGDAARDVAEGVHGVVFVATAPVWLPAYAIAASLTCPPAMRGALLDPPARTDVDAFSVRRLPPLPPPAGLSDPAAFAVAGPSGAISAAPDPSTVIVSRHDISTVLLLPEAPAGQPRWQHFEYAAATDGRCAGDPFTHQPGRGTRLIDGSEIIARDPPLIYGPPPTALASDRSVTAMPAPGRFDLPAYEPRRWQGGGEPPPHRFVGQLPDGAWVAMTEHNRRNEAALRWQRTVRVIAPAGRRDFALPIESAAAVTAQVLGDGTMLIAETIGPRDAQTWLLRRARIPAGRDDGVLELSPPIVVAPATFPTFILESVVGQVETGGHLRLHMGLRPPTSLGGPPTVIAAYRM